MNKWFEKIAVCTKKLRTQLFGAYCFVFTLFFIAVSLLVSGSIRDLLIKQIGSNRIAVLRQIGERANLIKTSSTTLSNLYTHEIISHDFLNKPLSEREHKKAWEYLDSQKKIYDEIIGPIGHEVVIWGENGFFYNSGEIDTDTWVYQPWYKNLLTAISEGNEGEIHFSRTFSAYKKGERTYQFAAGRFLGSGDEKHVLLILIDEKQLEDLYGSVQEQGGQVYLYDQNGFIVSHSNKKMLGKQFIDVNYMQKTYGTENSNIIQKLGKSYVLSTHLDQKTGWTIAEESPTKIILGALNDTYWIIGSILITGLILAVAVSVYISRRISTPLTALSDAMDKFGSPDFTPPCVARGTQEIDHLQESFKHMADEISSLMERIQEREKQKRALEVNFLRAQINPHFLYNTLFSIRCAVEVGKNEQAAKMLSAFIDLLRSTLAVKNTTIFVLSPTRHLREWLYFLQLKCYGEKINYEIEMPKDTEDCMVPPLILQPLVENAIFHGLEAKSEAGTVIIESAFQGNNLLLTITDDGAGMDSETLEKVRASLHQTVIKDAHSIGMSNVHNRIRLNYGEDYGMSIDSFQGMGTTITLLMPAIKQKEEIQ